MKKIFILTAFIGTTLLAGKGSVYSKYGIGELNIFSSDRTVGMGNTGVALLGESFINLENPAGLGNISRTLFTGIYQHQTYQISDAASSLLLNTGNVEGAVVAFPLYKPAKSVLSLAFVPYSSSGYNLTTNSTFGSHTITETFSGHGGLNAAQLSLSYEVQPDIIFGLTSHYFFGARYASQKVSFNDPNYFGETFDETISMDGFGFTLGAIITGVDKMFGLSDSKNFTLGGTFFSGSTLSVEQEQLTRYSTSQDTLNQLNQTATLPFGFSFGAAMLHNRTIFTADMRFQNWGNYRVNNIHPAELQNDLRIGAGIEVLPPAEFAETIFDRLSYRAGAYYHITNLKLKGQSINEIFGTAGIGFPASQESRINIGLEYGIRGTTSSGLLKDTIVRLTVGMTISELMFIQSEVD
ncbi:MAG: hypothetical protein H3C35_08825 [Bacteroidetes bacterium]|nr:hypothetical protein [Bacteroidota bacterium]